MKTVFVCHNYSDDSFASASKCLAEYLSLNGYRVVFLSHRPRGLKAFSLNNLIVLPWPVKKRPTTIKAVLFFIKMLFRYKPDYVIGHFGGAIIASVFSKIFSLRKVKVFNVYHTLTSQNILDYQGNAFLSKLKKQRRKLFYKLFVDEIIAPSNAAKADYINNWPGKKIHVVYNGYKTRQVEKNTRKAYDNKELLFLGRLDVSKGVGVLLKAFDEYTRAKPQTKLTLKLVGKVQGKILHNGRNDRIKFEGVIPYDKIPDIITGAYFLVAPSLMDNLPTAGIESLAYNTPVVASNKGGWPEIVKDNMNGFIIEPTVEDIIKILEKLELLSWNDYQAFCVNARKQYEERFTIDRYVKSIQEILMLQ